MSHEPAAGINELKLAVNQLTVHAQQLERQLGSLEVITRQLAAQAHLLAERQRSVDTIFESTAARLAASNDDLNAALDAVASQTSTHIEDIARVLGQAKDHHEAILLKLDSDLRSQLAEAQTIAQQVTAHTANQYREAAADLLSAARTLATESADRQRRSYEAIERDIESQFLEIQESTRADLAKAFEEWRASISSSDLTDIVAQATQATILELKFEILEEIRRPWWRRRRRG